MTRTPAWRPAGAGSLAGRRGPDRLGAEPRPQDDDGAPKPGALPDFVVLINPETGDDRGYRTKVETFDPPTADQPQAPSAAQPAN